MRHKNKKVFLTLALALLYISPVSFLHALTGSMGEIKIIHNSQHNNTNGVRVEVHDLTVNGMKGQKFYMGINVFQDGKWLDMWVGTGIFEPQFDPVYYQGVSAWFHYGYDVFASKGDRSKPYTIWIFVINSANKDDSFEKSVEMRLSDARIPEVSAPVVTDTRPSAPKKSKTSRRLERIKKYADALKQLGALGKINLSKVKVPADPRQKKAFMTAKVRMEKEEKKVFGLVKRTKTDALQKQKQAQLDKKGKEQTAKAETQVQSEAKAKENEAATQGETKLKNEAEPKAEQAKAKIDNEGKKGEAEVEKETEESEAEVEKAQKENKSASQLKGICGTCQKAIEAADAKAREYVKAGAKTAKAEAKKHIEAAAEKLKKETVGRLEAKADELKENIKGTVDDTAEDLGSQVKTESSTAVKTQIEKSVGAMPANLKPHAEQFKGQVEEKINTYLDKQVDSVMEEAAGRITKFADDKIDSVVKKFTGPIHDKIDEKTEQAVKYAHNKIDQATTFALKQLDTKKEQALARLKKACEKKKDEVAEKKEEKKEEKKNEAPSFAFSYSNPLIQIGITERSRVTFKDNPSTVYDSGAGQVVLKVPGSAPIVFNGCTFAVAISGDGKTPTGVRPNGPCTGMPISFGFLSGTVARFDRIDITGNQIYIKGLYINSPSLMFGSDALAVSGYFHVNVTYTSEGGTKGCAAVSFQYPVPNITGTKSKWSSPTMSVSDYRAELQNPTVRWKRTGCNSFQREFGTP